MSYGGVCCRKYGARKCLGARALYMRDSVLPSIIVSVSILVFCSQVNSGPFSDFKAPELSEEFTSAPTAKWETPTSKSLEQAKELLDPTLSENWSQVRDDYLITGKVVFDDNVKVIMQDFVEEPHEVSLVVKIPDYLQSIQEFVLLIENNPIQAAARIYPHRPIETVGMNVRLEDDSPVRAALKDKFGTWHVGSKMVFVKNPGGCSLPSCDPEIQKCVTGEIGKILISQFNREGGAWRVKTKITHPMDTGFVIDDNGEVVPSYYIDRIDFSDENGSIAEIETYAALSTNPVIMLDLPTRGQHVRINVRDIKGLQFEAVEPAPSM
ncbi:MAG TPA: hypothetical protein EYN80_06030 [Alphaproteobacteria bacterium]|nr:hypothetical protein [Alphaproteobacteria bacterium]HIN92753.1 hypothetical protein [Alphaproteobacteria bacterium]